MGVWGWPEEAAPPSCREPFAACIMSDEMGRFPMHCRDNAAGRGERMMQSVSVSDFRTWATFPLHGPPCRRPRHPVRGPGAPDLEDLHLEHHLGLGEVLVRHQLLRHAHRLLGVAHHHQVLLLVDEEIARIHHLADLVRRDRNHISVFAWSIGNEVDYPNDPYSHPVLDGSEENGFTQPIFGGYKKDAPDAMRLGAIAKRLVAVVKKYDTSRPVTAGLAGVAMSNETEYPGASPGRRHRRRRRR